MRSLASDLRYVYLHVTLPERLAEGLSPIDDTWQDFGGEESAGAPQAGSHARRLEVGDGVVGEELWNDQRFRFGRWVAGIEPDPSRPTLHYLHTLLPHRPWRYLPDGTQYGTPRRRA